jgi:hypothetical protein
VEVVAAIFGVHRNQDELSLLRGPTLRSGPFPVWRQLPQGAYVGTADRSQATFQPARQDSRTRTSLFRTGSRRGSRPGSDVRKT